MKKYIGTKIVNAKPMSRAEYNLFRGWKLPEDENGDDEGYLIEYVGPGQKANTDEYSGYVSWSPKDVFDLSYNSAETFFDRMIIEHKDLNGKVEKLNKFVCSDDVHSVSDTEHGLLRCQLIAMQGYLQILEMRMKRIR